jgi:hypothetical protein
MRSYLILVSSAAWVLLWASPGSALSPETTCENAKLRAAAGYHRCLIRAHKEANAHGDEPSEHALARCDERFDRAFERAEGAGACRTPGGSSTLREPLKAEVQTLADNLMAGTSCAELAITAGEVATCAVSKTTSAIDLAAVVQQFSTFGVTAATTVWIQAWGGDGSHGNTSNGGSGGPGGYAQTTTSVNDLVASYGTSELYYYLGLNGTVAANAGGVGGTATLAPVTDLTAEQPSLDDTLLLAGGGGGGGGGRGTYTACGNLDAAELTVLGGSGGAAGVAIAATDAAKSGAGEQGGARRGENFSGEGGHDGQAGAGVPPPNTGDGGLAALGGRGGNHQTPQIGFANQSGVLITAHGGPGGEPGDDAGGGGGGGGYGSGGGGAEGSGISDCVSGGGGGGGSLAAQSTASCPGAPQTRPDNPNGIEGFVQITFDLGVCE